MDDELDVSTSSSDEEAEEDGSNLGSSDNGAEEEGTNSEEAEGVTGSSDGVSSDVADADSGAIDDAVSTDDEEIGSLETLASSTALLALDAS